MKRYGTEMMVMGSVLLAAAGQTSMKLGLLARGPLATVLINRPLAITIGVVGGLGLYVLGTLLWIVAITRRNISYLYPLVAANYVLMCLVGHFFLHEPMGRLRWAGIFTIALGVALMAQTSNEVFE